jgi:hypothetical protein
MSMQSLYKAIKIKDINKVKILLNTKLKESDELTNKSPIQMAANVGDLEIFKLLYNDKRFFLKADFDRILSSTIINEHIKIFNFLFLEEKIKPPITIMKHAFVSGNIHFINSLIKHSNIEVDYEEMLRISILNDYPDILKIALKNTDPSVCKNKITYYAYDHNKIEILDILWNDERVKKTLHNDYDFLYNRLLKKDIKSKIEKF